MSSKKNKQKSKQSDITIKSSAKVEYCGWCQSPKGQCTNSSHKD